MSESSSVLVVAERGDSLPTLGSVPIQTVAFQFPRSTPADGFSAWQTDAGNIDVAADCRDQSGGFSLQALNRPVANRLLRESISALVVTGSTGCVFDLPRVAHLLGVPAVWLVDDNLPTPEALDSMTRRWMQSSLRQCEAVFPLSTEASDALSAWCEASPEIMAAGTDDLVDILQALHDRTLPDDKQFDYAIYEFCQRDHPLLVRMQQGDTTHFEGCSRVLDLGCGVGIFLDCLQRQGVAATGVERDATIADYGRGMGLDIITADAVDYLGGQTSAYDGVYCSHFVEHLPFDAVERLVSGVAAALQPGGVAVFAFPDPESIRSQLLGFWRDPEHVRFYHPELIISLAFTAGLDLEWSSHQAQPHRIVSFSEEPGEVSAPLELPPLELPAAPASALGRLLARIGLASRGDFVAQREAMLTWSSQMRHSVARQQEAALQLQERTERLWEVNRTWAWNDNVTLRLRKRA